MPQNYRVQIRSVIGGGQHGAIMLLMLALVSMFGALTAWSAEPNEPGGLQLVAKIGAAEYRDFKVVDGKIFGRFEDRLIEIGSSVQWRVEGDLFAGRQFIMFSPSYSIARVGGTSVRLGMARRIHLHITPYHSQRDWKAAEVDAGIFVIVWLAGGKCSWTVTTPGMGGLLGAYRRDGILEVPDSDSVGFPLVLLWSHGRFQPANPNFSDDAANELVASMFVEPSDSWRTRARLVRDVTRAGPGGITLLHLAAQAGLVDVCQELIDRGATMSASARGGNALEWALHAGRRQVVSMLMTRFGRPGPSAVEEAFQNEHFAIAFDLLTSGDKWLGTAEALQQIASAAAGLVVRDVLVRMAAMQVGKLKFPNDALISSLRVRDLDAMRALVSLGANPNLRDVGGSTPLQWAAKAQDFESLKVFLDAKAAVDRVDSRGVSALMYAAEGTNATIVSALIEAGANPLRTDLDGWTALHHLVGASCSPDVLDVLLKHSPSLDAKDKKNRSALEIALKNHSMTIAARLAASGARLDVQQPGINSSIEAAVLGDVSDVIAHAIDDGWDASVPLSDEWNAFGLARAVNATKTIAVFERHHVAEKTPRSWGSAERLTANPRMVKSDGPRDPRTGDEEFPEVFIPVQCIVDARGRAIFPRTPEGADAILALEARRVAQESVFEPAKVNGENVARPVEMLVHFRAFDQRIWNVTEVDVRPSPLQPLDLGNIAISSSSVTARAEAGGNGPQSSKNVVRPDGYWATVRCVVERDGHTTHIEVLDLSSPVLEGVARDAVARHEFSPGMRGGVATRVRVVMVLRARH